MSLDSLSTDPTEASFLDRSLYSLNRENSRKAIEAGLAEAEWYQCPVPRKMMRDLLVRKNGPAIRDTIIWFGLISMSGAATIALWGSWWVVIPYLIYAVLWSSSADSRWHECGHGTAFKTDWMNAALYEIASFMILRESTIWRWSHTRHHSDTIIVGRDPEIAVPRPPDVRGMILGLFALPVYPKYFSRLWLHAARKVTEDEREFLPEREYERVFWTARIHLAIYVLVASVALLLGSWLPLFLMGLPNLFGSWLMSVYGLTQHTGLAEDVLDHRLNSRTFLTNRLNRFLYWNMNYHVEHHMFPLVPYHALPRLHELIKEECPAPYPSLWACWQEIIPTVRRQTKDPGHHARRELPETAGRARSPKPMAISDAAPDKEGWVEVCDAAAVDCADAFRFDHRSETYAIYRDAEGSLYATDGICTHGTTHLADGLVVDSMIECPKHNGRFNLQDGSPARRPVCVALQTYQIEERERRIWVRVGDPAS